MRKRKRKNENENETEKENENWTDRRNRAQHTVCDVNYGARMVGVIMVRIGCYRIGCLLCDRM